MSTKKLIRIIIYEGPEELVNLYDKNSFLGIRKGGIPEIWTRDMLVKEREHIRMLGMKEGVKISGHTMKNIDPANSVELATEFNLALDIHEGKINK